MAERFTLTLGDKLEKLNLLACPKCGAVYFPPDQAAKIGVSAGWVKSRAEAQTRSDTAKPKYDGVIRISDGRRGQKICPDCRPS